VLKEQAMCIAENEFRDLLTYFQNQWIERVWILLIVINIPLILLWLNFNFNQDSSVIQRIYSQIQLTIWKRNGYKAADEMDMSHCCDDFSC
jgi:hypothetical protein